MSRIITRVSTDTGGDETINNITELDTTITESNSSSEGTIVVNQAANSEIYYTLDITGSSTGNEMFTVYSKIKNNIYIGVNVEHIINANINANLWRIRKAFDYNYLNGIMTAIGNEYLQGGESEFTYITDGSADFTGGYHGDEIQILAKFFANGIEISNINSNISLTSCDEWYYINKSNTIAYGTSTNETVHDKITYIKDGGYSTFNRLEWLLSSNVNYWYLGLSSISKTVGETIGNDYLNYFNVNSDGARKIQQIGGKKAYYSNETDNISCFINASLIKPINKDGDCEMEIWDAAPYSKYYRKFTPTTNPIIGDVWESEMVVNFDAI